MSDKLKNPFYNMLYWVKGEIADIKSMNQALETRVTLLQTMVKTSTKRESTQKELDSLQGGKTSFKTFFKSTNEKQSYSISLQNQIDHANKSYNCYLQVLAIVNWYLM